MRLAPSCHFPPIPAIRIFVVPFIFFAVVPVPPNSLKIMGVKVIVFELRRIPPIVWRAYVIPKVTVIIPRRIPIKIRSFFFTPELHTAFTFCSTGRAGGTFLVLKFAMRGL